MKKVNQSILAGIILLLINSPAFAQDEKKEKQNDFNTPLHLLTPEYITPYGVCGEQAVKATLDRVFAYLDKETPYSLVDQNGKALNDLTKITATDKLARGAFRLASYEWGVTYAGMLNAGEATGDKRYSDYTFNRLKFLTDVAPGFRKAGVIDPQLEQLLHPKALDDAGSMCLAFIKATEQYKFPDETKRIIGNYVDYIMNKQFRLADGTLARVRPQPNTLWLDDMYMGIPALARMGKYSSGKRYYDEAIRQIKLFSERMFVKEQGLFMHGWVEGMKSHPTWFWGRANGWALLTLVEVLDALPKDYPGSEELIQLLNQHVGGLARLQSAEGRWHQLLDRNDSYLETSATAIYVYSFAKAINHGWIDAKAYGPAVMLGWNAVAKQVNEEGQVEGTCVGTGMGFDPAYYCHRPVSVFAAHGYGPVLLAGGEVIKLLKQNYPKMNDSAVQFYYNEVKTDKPIFDMPND